MSKTATHTPPKRGAKSLIPLSKPTPEFVFSDEDRIKAAQARKERFAVRKLRGIPRPLVVIRQHCLDCVGGVAKDVKECPLAKKCGVWLYRMGRKPTEEDKMCAQFRNGKLTHWIPYEEVIK